MNLRDSVNLLPALFLAIGLTSCYTTFRPPTTFEQPTTTLDSTQSTQQALEQEVFEFEPALPNYGMNNFWGPSYNNPYWGGFYPYGYGYNSPWGSYYYQPWWGNNYYNPSYPYYPSPGPSQPGQPPDKRNTPPRGDLNNPPPPSQQAPSYNPPPSQNQTQPQQNPPNNDDNKKRDTDRRGRRS
jgi:hypothetical protein